MDVQVIFMGVCSVSKNMGNPSLLWFMSYINDTLLSTSPKLKYFSYNFGNLFHSTNITDILINQSAKETISTQHYI